MKQITSKQFKEVARLIHEYDIKLPIKSIRTTKKYKYIIRSVDGSVRKFYHDGTLAQYVLVLNNTNSSPVNNVVFLDSTKPVPQTIPDKGLYSQLIMHTPGGIVMTKNFLPGQGFPDMYLKNRHNHIVELLRVGCFQVMKHKDKIQLTYYPYINSNMEDKTPQTLTIDEREFENLISILIQFNLEQVNNVVITKGKLPFERNSR